MQPGPFLGREAIQRRDLSAYQLRRDYRAVYRNVYVAKQIELTPAIRARAAWLWSGGDGVLVGLSAAALLRTKWLDVTHPAELVRANRHCPAGIVIRSYQLAGSETCVVDGMCITTPARTAFDLGRMLPQDRSIPILDALLNATDVKIADIVSIMDRTQGARGMRRLRSTLKLVDGGAESPQESRVRTLLVRTGIPAPETQIEFVDDFGEVRIRVDMGWREWKVAVEYDGVQHWSDRCQRSWDIDRIALLEAAGWAVVRVSAEMLSRPHVIVERVTAKLRTAGCPL